MTDEAVTANPTPPHHISLRQSWKSGASLGCWSLRSTLLDHCHFPSRIPQNILYFELFEVDTGFGSVNTPDSAYSVHVVAPPCRCSRGGAWRRPQPVGPGTWCLSLTAAIDRLFSPDSVLHGSPMTSRSTSAGVHRTFGEPWHGHAFPPPRDRYTVATVWTVLCAVTSVLTLWVSGHSKTDLDPASPADAVASHATSQPPFSPCSRKSPRPLRSGRPVCQGHRLGKKKVGYS